MCDFNDFVSVFDLRDLIFVGILIVNILIFGVNMLMFGLTAWWIRRQVHVTDVKVYFQIMQGLTDTYEQYKDAEDKDQDYKLVVFLNFLESLARFYYECRIHDVTRDMVEEYLLGIVPTIGKEGPARRAFLQNRSGPDTYSYLQRFAKLNGIEGVTYSETVEAVDTDSAGSERS